MEILRETIANMRLRRTQSQLSCVQVPSTKAKLPVMRVERHVPRLVRIGPDMRWIESLWLTLATSGLTSPCKCDNVDIAEEILVTLKQVAQLAQVSIKTASRALNRDGYVSPDTLERVTAAAKAVSYRPDRAARMMRAGRTEIVGLLSHHMVASPFTTEILHAVETTAEAAGKAVIIADAGSRGLERPLQLLREFRAEPILFATEYHMPADELLPVGFTGILINCFASDQPSIVPDDESGGYVQARHLVELGHRRIAMIELPEGVIARRLRRQGVRRALAEAGLQIDSMPSLPGHVGPPAARRMAAFEAAMELLAHSPRPTALLCSKDEYALQAFGAAAVLGLRIPDDVSVIGFDDLQLLTKTMRPTLTTVRLPYFEMGRIAAEAAIAGEAVAPGVQRVPCPLVLRASTREA